MSRPRMDCGQAPPAPPDRATRAELVLDAAALAGLRELDPTGRNRLMERVFAAFRTSAARLVPQLLESQRHADLQGVRHVAHTLKSSAASVGGMNLSGLCADLEARIREGRSGDLQPQVEALAEEVDRLLAALQHVRASGAQSGAQESAGPRPSGLDPLGGPDAERQVRGRS